MEFVYRLVRFMSIGEFSRNIYIYIYIEAPKLFLLGDQILVFSEVRRVSTKVEEGRGLG
jgi:hypothetical protein